MVTLKVKTHIAAKKFAGSVWLFPGLMVTILVVLTVLRISGSSVNIYDQLLQFKGGHSKLLYGEPKNGKI